MSNNDSSAAGVLLPISAPDYDDRLDDLFLTTIQGLTPIPADLVMPRWQEEPPELPPIGTDWVSVGVTSIEPDDFAAEVHIGSSGIPGDNGSSQLIDTELITVMLSFYGPNAMWNARNVSKGIQLNQNRDLLDASGISSVATNAPVNLPVQIHNKWVRRVDVRWTTRRRAVHVYSILDIAGADVDFTFDVKNMTDISFITNAQNKGQS